MKRILYAAVTASVEKNGSKKQICTTFLRKRNGTERYMGILLCTQAACLRNSAGYYKHQLKEP